jgi:hypothetical protein
LSAGTTCSTVLTLACCRHPVCGDIPRTRYAACGGLCQGRAFRQRHTLASNRLGVVEGSGARRAGMRVDAVAAWIQDVGAVVRVKEERGMRGPTPQSQWLAAGIRLPPVQALEHSRGVFKPAPAAGRLTRLLVQARSQSRRRAGFVALSRARRQAPSQQSTRPPLLSLPPPSRQPLLLPSLAVRASVVGCLWSGDERERMEWTSAAARSRGLSVQLRTALLMAARGAAINSHRHMPTLPQQSLGATRLA